MTAKKQLIQALSKFGRVISHDAKVSNRCLAFERETELDLLTQHFELSSHKSLLLRGPSGGGKSAILREFFRRISTQAKRKWIVLETSTTQILTGTKYIGEWETRLQSLIDLATAKNRVAVYFTDIANLPGAGRTSSSDTNMAESIAPFVQRGVFVLVGECNDDTYQRVTQKYPWFQQFFRTIQVDLLDNRSYVELVKRVAEDRANQFVELYQRELIWTPPALEAIGRFGEIYCSGLARPAGAVQLMDHVVRELGDSSGQTQSEVRTITCDYPRIVQGLGTLTGMPSNLLDDSVPLTLNAVRDFLETRVMGQEEAVSSMVDLVAMIKAGLNDLGKPMGVYLFVGPTGVGKTALANSLAEYVFGSADRLLRLDMSEYKHYYSYEKLIGGQNASNSSPVQSGNLLGKVRNQPFSVILLDEIEKAHPNVFDLLLQLFDDGRLTNQRGETTSFTQTIIIMTSNLGSDKLDRGKLGFADKTEQGDASGILDSVQQFFRPELVNRIDRIVEFKRLEKKHIRLIAQRELGRVLMRDGITRRQLRVDIDRAVIDLISEQGFHPKYGARPLKRAVERLILLPLARQMVRITESNKPAMLRILPDGNSVKLKVVHDRQARRAESISRGIRVVDPVDDQEKRQSPEAIEACFDKLKTQVRSLERERVDRKLVRQKSRLVSQSCAVDFWDQPHDARDVMAELFRIERILDAIKSIKRRTDELSDSLRSARLDGRPHLWADVYRTTVELARHADIVQYSLSARDQLDRCDAFVVVDAIDMPSEDLVGRLALAYRNWAQRKGFSATIVHEELGPDCFGREEIAKQLVLMIEGVTVYGLLHNEAGLHEFSFGERTKGTRVERENESGMRHQRSRKTGHDRAHKQKFFLKVSVLPIAEKEERDDRGIQLKHTTIKEHGLHCGRLLSRVVAEDASSHTTIQLKSDQPRKIICEHALDLLVAERLRKQRQTDEGAQESSDQVVRRYTMSPVQKIKDSRTGVVTKKLVDYWKGDIDEFIVGAIDTRLSE